VQHGNARHIEVQEEAGELADEAVVLHLHCDEGFLNILGEILAKGTRNIFSAMINDRHMAAAECDRSDMFVPEWPSGGAPITKLWDSCLVAVPNVEHIVERARAAWIWCAVSNALQGIEIDIRRDIFIRCGFKQSVLLRRDSNELGIMCSTVIFPVLVLENDDDVFVSFIFRHYSSLRVGDMMSPG
jgi:hypothetical protein